MTYQTTLEFQWKAISGLHSGIQTILQSQQALEKFRYLDCIVNRPLDKLKSLGTSRF